MEEHKQLNEIWAGLSSEFARTADTFQNSVAAVHGGGRSSSSAIVWRPGILVTTRHTLRRREGIQVIQPAYQGPAELAGVDPGTDLAVLRFSESSLQPVTTSSAARVGELVLAIGRSRLGDLSSSAGVIARVGAAWRTWHGGTIDRLVRPDVRIYVGQEGSALVDQNGKVLGMNTTALARNAVITVPAATIDRVVDAIVERGHVPQPYLGLAMQAVPVPENLRGQLPQEMDQILLVMHLEPVAPAATGGVQVGDLVVSVNGSTLQHVSHFQRRLSAMQIGETLTLEVLRGGAQVALSLRVGDRD